MINATYVPNEHPTRKYPYLGEWISGDGIRTVVLFSEPKIGTVVFCDGDDMDDQVGDYSKSWSEENFVDCVGTIQLTNARL